MILDPLGFREYDARWLWGIGVDGDGIRTTGRAFGELMRRRGAGNRVLIGHDFRSCSKTVSGALAEGLIQAGCRITDLGLTISPAAYFAQIAQNIPALAMVTASHNPNGWTGLKLSLAPRSTLMPDDMAELRGIALSPPMPVYTDGAMQQSIDGSAGYIAHFGSLPPVRRKLRIAAACGNGTASIFAPRILAAAGLDVVPLDCQLDETFPNCDPNPEDMRMLARLGAAVRRHHADIGFAFDGDGDRCGFADERGEPVSADKIGLLLARHLSDERPGSHFIVDVKSTGLFATDNVLRLNGSNVEYWKTGHSYMRQRLHGTGALAAFEKSGHFFLNPPHGLGYDDAITSALALCRVMDRHGAPSLSQLVNGLPRTHVTPTMSAACPDDAKYRIAEAVRRHYEAAAMAAGQPIIARATICGIRFTLADGSWGLVRASSNKPELAVVCESPVSAHMMQAVFADIKTLLRTYPEVGAFNQGPETQASA